MTNAQSIRHSQVVVWTLICVLTLLLVLAVLTRLAGATSDEPPIKPVTTYIVSPFNGVFVAGAYRGADAEVTIGSKVEPGTVMGSVEVWGKLHPIHSTVRGTVIEVLVFDDALVTARQSLFKIQIESNSPPA